jgi:hypothetical protein
MKKYALFVVVLLLCTAFFYLPKNYFSDVPECRALTVVGDELSTANQQRFRDLLEAQSPQDFRYFFQTFLEENGHTYMVTNFRNEAACFNVKMLVTQWNKLGGMLRTNGQSYPEELYGLQWEIKRVNGAEEVVYADMRSIID